MTTKTFRGILGDGEYEQIYLTGGDEKTAFRIVKFEIVTAAPSTSSEHLAQIWKTRSAAESGRHLSDIDFSVDTLLGIALWSNDSSAQTYSDDFHVIFDKLIINQDIYVSNQTINGSNSLNYHLELEEVKMSDNEAAVVNFSAALLHK